MHKDLKDRLRGDAILIGLMGEKNGRPAIDWVSRPDVSTADAITMTDIFTRPAYKQDGQAGWREATVQFDVWSHTVSNSVKATAQIEELFKSKGTFGTTVFGRGYISSGPRNMRVEDLPGGQRLNHRSVDFRFQYKTAI